MINYATKISRYNEPGIHYIDIYPTIMAVEMCVEPDIQVYEIEITETDEPRDNSYWAWKDPDGYISTIHYAFFLMDMCFPDGSAAEEKAGRGKVIRVNIKEIRKVI